MSGTGVPAERVACEEGDEDVQTVWESRFVSVSGGLVMWKVAAASSTMVVCLDLQTLERLSAFAASGVRSGWSGLRPLFESDPESET